MGARRGTGTCTIWICGQLCVALGSAATLLKEVADMQGIGANKVDLSNEVLKTLPGLEGRNFPR